MKRTTTSITPRIPIESYGEEKTLRVCVAPTVWQCVYSIPRFGTLHIYGVDADLPTEPIGGISDIETTHEKWITDDNVQLCRGQIAMRRKGVIEITRDLKTCLKVHCKTGKIQPNRSKDDLVWDIEGEVWSLKPELVM